MRESEYKYPFLKYIIIILGIISIISCLITILTFFIFKRIRSFILELVIYLSISALLQTISFIIYFPENSEESANNLCQFQAFSMELFGLSEFVWTCLISYSIFQSVIYLKNYSKNNTYLCLTRIVFISIGFGFPLLVSLLGLVFDVYGVAGFWCFIDTNEKHKNKDNKYEIFYLITFALLWCCIIFNLILYSIVIKYIKKTFDENEENRIKNYTRPLIIYSVIQISCIFPTTIIRIYQLFTYNYPKELDWVQSICDSSQGFLYSLAYGFNPIVKRTILSLFRKENLNESQDNDDDNDYDYNNSIIRKRSNNSALRSNLDFTYISFLD